MQKKHRQCYSQATGRESNCCLKPSVHFVNYIIVSTRDLEWDDDDDDALLILLCSAGWLGIGMVPAPWNNGRHVELSVQPVILTPSQTDFALSTSYSCVRRGEEEKKDNFVVHSLLYIVWPADWGWNISHDPKTLMITSLRRCARYNQQNDYIALIKCKMFMK